MQDYLARVTVSEPKDKKLETKLKRRGFVRDSKGLYVFRTSVAETNVYTINQARRRIYEKLKEYFSNLNIDFEIGICPYQGYLT